MILFEILIRRSMLILTQMTTVQFLTNICAVSTSSFRNEQQIALLWTGRQSSSITTQPSKLNKFIIYLCRTARLWDFSTYTNACIYTVSNTAVSTHVGYTSPQHTKPTTQGKIVAYSGRFLKGEVGSNLPLVPVLLTNENCSYSHYNIRPKSSSDNVHVARSSATHKQVTFSTLVNTWITVHMK